MQENYGPEFYMKHLYLALRSLSFKKQWKDKEEVKEYTRKLIDDSGLEGRVKEMLSNPVSGKDYNYEKDDCYSIEEKQILDVLLVLCVNLHFKVGKMNDITGFCNTILEERPGIINRLF